MLMSSFCIMYFTLMPRIANYIFGLSRSHFAT